MFQSKGPSPVKTIADPVSLSGIALHSGQSSKLTFLPGNEVGIFFIYRGKKLPAIADYVTGTNRGTALGDIQVVEHVLSAVSGLGIGALDIELSTNEPPAMDGSAYPFAKALMSAGIREFEGKRQVVEIDSPIYLKDGGASIEALPYDGFEIKFMVDFPIIGYQEFTFSSNYLDEISQARTFGYLEELENLKKCGMAFGASTENALVLSRSGYVNSPRFENEPVRHKILDLIGDLELVGSDIKAKINAVKSGHKLNIALAKKIREIGKGAK
ncbi:UDP-3-O-[3-hydroxymyristoyl] N-acetylglucosamine deacetylase [Candidatus Saganbacteria bacterium]|nr:UDP-3-O-[3-hydroxymyristoyl] N-acetylglucosamine deacetylase [Candidatus Saganbacteria bacterium]